MSGPLALPVAHRRNLPLTPSLRRHQLDVVRWALSSGRPLNADALSVILCTQQSITDGTDRPFMLWTEAFLMAFLWTDVAEFCRARSVQPPPSTAESLWTYLLYLDSQHLFAAGSATLSDLRVALRDHGSLPASRRRHPAGRPTRTRSDATVLQFAGVPRR